MKLRVALLGIYHESNTFIPWSTPLRAFSRLQGTEITAAYHKAYHEIGGMLEVLEAEGVEAVPVYFATATPGGTVDAGAYAVLQAEMFAALRMTMPVDGCLVIPHGAGVSDTYRDMDGQWLRALRTFLGPGVPVIGTLDPHANVSPQMIAATDALVAYATNPHVDQRETGRKAASLMVRTLRGEIRPVQHLCSMPLVISIEQQYTDAEPCRSLYHFAASMARKENLLSVSLLLGFPYADVPEMGSAAIVVTDDNGGKAQHAGSLLRTYMLDRHALFRGQLQDIAETMKILQRCEKPALLLDMGDNVGAGAPGDNTALLKALESGSIGRSFVCLYDPEAVSEAARQQVGDRFLLRMGGKEEQNAYCATVELLRLSDGKFRESAPRHGGQTQFDMGRTAIVETERGNVVMLTSQRIPPFSLQQLIANGIEPETFDVLVAKGVNAPVAAYGPVCRTILQVDTPGPTQADIRRFEYLHRRKPLFPFEEINTK
ncbi:M81 family metallopeptidase [Chitinophaga lutea]